MNNRGIHREISSVRTIEAQQDSNIHSVGMVLQPGDWQHNDPFLFLAEDWFEQGTFDVHPHRGIETVTYVISGHLKHYDNKFGDGELSPGDVQWMTAGGGVIHKEDPADGETVHSLQLWVNLPKEQKMTTPRYQNLRSQDMPVRREQGALIRVFSGRSADVEAPTKNHVPVTMVEINLKPGASISQDLPADYNGFMYVLEGQGKFGSNQVEGAKKQVLWLGNADGAEDSSVEIHADTKMRVLLYAGRPLHEPVVAYGPFVMNTKAQIAQAFDDYQSGKFAH
ncbi:pirin family protein [Alicyclobacillus sp. SO9]|uniref:pirin family protein n=1 Tax=Alicyclobacillus sp. SO9 TaxID=2665646 RepID=UPI0018E8B71A|nr:pirin family protein [Alicyclobacillus sp. SO9]QQE77829.1 pirin family protein [Alicyclobacillus sp. SO9]